jgi:O-antigen ligase
MKLQCQAKNVKSRAYNYLLMTSVLRYIEGKSDLWALLSLYTLCLTGFLISFPGRIVLYSLGAFLTFSLFCWIAEIEANLKTLKNNLFLIIPFAGYFLLIMIYAANSGMFWSYMEKRLIFILFPVISVGAFRSNRYIDGGYLKFFKSFIAGLLLISAFLLLRAGLIYTGFLEKPVFPYYSIEAANKSFISSSLSFFQLPAYLSMELNMAVAFLVISGNKFRTGMIIRRLIMIYFIVLIYLLSSRAGMIACFFLIVLLMYFKVKEKEHWKLPYFIYAGSVVVVLLIVFLLNPKTTGLVEGFRNSLKENRINLVDLEPRTRVWFSAFNIIRDNAVFGVGVKDLDQVRVDEYRRHGFYSEAFYNLNSHNQFLETQLTFGIPGTILLIWMLFAPFSGRRYLRDNKMYYSFLLVVIIQFMFESMLVRQAGIIFFVIISCLLINYRHEPGKVIT